MKNIRQKPMPFGIGAKRRFKRPPTVRELCSDLNKQLQSWAIKEKKKKIAKKNTDEISKKLKIHKFRMKHNKVLVMYRPVFIAPYN